MNHQNDVSSTLRTFFSLLLDDNEAHHLLCRYGWIVGFLQLNVYWGLCYTTPLSSFLDQDQTPPLFPRPCPSPYPLVVYLTSLPIASPFR